VEIATLTVTNVRDPAAVAAVEAANAAALAAAAAADPADDGDAAPAAEMQPLPVLDVQMSVTVTAGPALRPVPAALPAPVRPAVASLTSKPNPFVDGARGLAGKAAQAERDVMKGASLCLDTTGHLPSCAPPALSFCLNVCHLCSPRPCDARHSPPFPPNDIDTLSLP